MVEAGVHAYGLTADQQDQLWQRWQEGEALPSVARQLGAPVQQVRRYVPQTGGVRPRPVGRSTRHLSLQEREEVSRGLAAGWSMRRIAAQLGRHPSTVSREVARNGGRDAYRAHDADIAGYERAKPPKVGKLRSRDRLLAAVSTGWSGSGPCSRSATGCASTTPATS
ncbi:MAG: helix-turn-helix domain-containing protein [Actinomycetota bacterium]|nr:helix-turn-helix domain-containing protein [Actinomycetota bacterium]